MINAPQETQFFIGTAGWAVPRPCATQFPAEGSHLERYSQVLAAVEINTSFYRPHRARTYEKWAASVPQNFRFAVKMPKQITHEHRLQEVNELLDRFLGEVAGLGEKLGPLLIQLPPSLAFHQALASQFLTALRNRFNGHVVWEPRHSSWFTSEAEAVLLNFQIARVAADPAILARAAQPGGWPGLTYHRLHGSPRMYYSSYAGEFLETLAARLEELATRQIPTWCIFDNTAEFAATDNALEILRKLSAARVRL